MDDNDHTGFLTPNERKYIDNRGDSPEAAATPFISSSEVEVIPIPVATPEGEVTLVVVDPPEATVLLDVAPSKKDEKVTLALVNVPGDEVPQLADSLEEFSVKDTASRLRTQYEGIDQMNELLRGLRNDLYRVRELNEKIREPQPGRRYEWRDMVLPELQDELRVLKHEIERWERDANTDHVSWIRDDLDVCLEPLRSGLPALESYREGELTGEDWRKAKNHHPDADENLRNEIEEWEARCEALNALLTERTRIEVFEYILQTEETVQATFDSDLRIKYVGDRTWKTYAGQELKRRGLIEEGDWEYRPTERGECVYEAYQTLVGSELIDGFAKSVSKPHAALHLLSHFHHPDIWAEPDEYDEPSQKTE